MTKKKEKIKACAMDLIDAYDRCLNAASQKDYDDRLKKFNLCLCRLSVYTGLIKATLATALINQYSSAAQSLNWLRDLGVDI